MEFGFTKLKVYQASMTLVEDVYQCLQTFPPEEKFALCDQLRRSSVSVPSNIAEGLGRAHQKETVHFLSMAYGSLMEVMSQLEVAQEENYISIEEFHNMETLIADTARLLSGLQRSFLPTEDLKQ